jgi:hypothetical protein
MTKGNLNNNTKTRRKGSMLQDSLSKIKYLIVLAFLLVIPMQAKAGEFGFDPIDQTDTGADRLIYYYDTVGRQTLIQLTNTSDSFVGYHFQVFNAAAGCEEFDFFACLTPGDTEVFDVEALPGNPDLSESNGFVAVSIANVDGCEALEFSLIGMFRIIDDSGYEYRTNAASSEDILAFDADFDILNFNDVNGNNLSDVVGITYVPLDVDQVTASPFIGAVFGFFDDPQNLIFDEIEQPTSCSPTVFSCDNGLVNTIGGYINKGIDNSVPNSQGFPRICNSSRLDGPFFGPVDAGWLFLPFAGYVCQDPDGTPESCDGQFGVFDEDVRFVGFLGLNNGDGTGSMDSWMSFSFGELLIPVGDTAAE